jgi:hypothetical protein
MSNSSAISLGNRSSGSMDAHSISSLGFIATVVLLMDFRTEMGKSKGEKCFPALAIIFLWFSFEWKSLKADADDILVPDAVMRGGFVWIDLFGPFQKSESVPNRPTFLLSDPFFLFVL